MCFSTLELVCDSMIKFNIVVAGLSETDLHFNNQQVKQSMQQVIRKFWSRKTIVTSEKNLTWKSKYKPGGTAMIVTNALSHNMTKSGQDPESLGRWSVTTIEGKNQNNVLIINIYRPGKITKDKGITKVSTQQWDLLEEQRRESEDVRNTMIEDLIKTINSIQSTNDQVLLLIDAHESFNSSEKGISSLVEHTRMIDPIANKHGTSDEPNTHKSGSKRIDYIFCINGLTKFIRLCGILPFDFITISDHRGLYIDIDLVLFLKCPLHQFITNNESLLRTNNPKCVTKYKTYIMEHMQQHDLFNKGQIIQNKINDHTISQLDIKKLNDIDASITLCCLNADQSLKIVQASYPWSPTLATSILLVQL